MKLSLSKQFGRALIMPLLVLTAMSLHAQNTPNALNFQAVARDAQGKPLSEKNVAVQISILENDANGTVAWQEQHQVKTSTLGLFTLNVGSGNKIAGTASSLNTIDWGKGAHYLKVEIDFGSGYQHFGTNQMLAVPYALYAEKAGNSEPDFSKFKFDGATNTLKNDGETVADLTPLKQSLEFDKDNYHLSISGSSGIVDLRQFIHSPQDLRYKDNQIWLTGNPDSSIIDLSRYQQKLSVSATSKLEISNGNSVAIDTSNTNEIQTISLNGSKVSLSRSGGEITIDPSATNELQNLTKVDGKLVLSQSSARAIPIDTSNVNEIQTIVRTGDKISLSNTTTEVSINDADASPTNELISSGSYNQNTRKLTLNEGTSSTTIDIAPKKVAFRAIKTTNNNVSVGTSILVFGDEKLDLSNSYDATTGVFTVPANGAGTYAFFFTPESL
ncbi:MAG TPA: hypothetical protein VHO90_07790, partial [Bacteroidales bacterium]|nr:hypothetical protein [Bacteroidales bacterium]